MPRVAVPWVDIRDWSPARIAAECPLMFAFGSNINPGQLMRRAPGCVFVSPSRINFARMRFYGDSPTRGGVATLRPSTSHEAWAPGILVVTTADCVKELDLSEGHGKTYARHLVTVTGPHHKPVRAFTYLRLSNLERGPDPEYVARIRAGYRFFGLNEAKLDAAVAHAPKWVAPAPSAKRPRLAYRGHPGLSPVEEYREDGAYHYKAPQGRPRSTPRPAGGRLGGAEYAAHREPELEGISDQDLRDWIDRTYDDREPGPDGV